MSIFSLFGLIVLIFSAIIHEISHGEVALMLGDKTAKLMGRISLNPIKHIDPIGTLLLPFVLIITGSSFIFGWAKPVPVNELNFKNPKKDMALTALAGPLSNIIISVILAILAHIFIATKVFDLSNQTIIALLFIIKINIYLAIFNLVPIPPLDGSKILFGFLPFKYNYIEDFLNQYGLLLLITFIFFFSWIVLPIAELIFNLLTFGL